jgi:hypothetical protein
MTTTKAQLDAQLTRGGDVAVPHLIGPITGGQRGLPFNPMPACVAQRYDYVE